MGRFKFRAVLLLVMLLSTGVLARSAAAQRFLDQLEGVLDRGASPPSAELPVEAPPGYLGLIADSADEGVAVVTVREASPAAAAGIMAGDTIMAIDGLAVASLDEMAAALEPHKAGEKIEVVLQRGEVRLTLPVLLGRAPAAASAAPAAPGAPAASGAFGVLGVRVANVTDAARGRYDLALRRGALIDTVKPRSPAAVAGLVVGNVIVSINGRRIDNADDLVKYLTTTRPGQKATIDYYAGSELREATLDLAGSTTTPIDPFAPDDPKAAAPREGVAVEEKPPAGSDALEELERRIGDAFAGEKPAAESPASKVPVAEAPSPKAATEDVDARLREMQSQLDALRKRISELETELKAVEK